MSVETLAPPAERSPRILLIDTLRGVALLAMASYHFTWDLEFFGYIEPGTATQGLWKLYARAIATSFLFLVGVSLVLAHGNGIRWASFQKRLGMVAGAALLISIGTYVALPDEWIFFGILHNITVSSLIALGFVGLPPIVPAIASLLLISGMVLDHYILPGVISFPALDPKYLAWTGFGAAIPRSNDFVPIFPWLASPLAGLAVAGFLKRAGAFPRLAGLQAKANLLTKAGQHSLVFYLVHQPVLIGLVYLFSLVHPAPAPDPVAAYMRSCTASCVGGGNEVGMCQSFCGCTKDKLIQQSLFEPLNRREINPATDERVQSLAMECSMSSREVPAESK
ncbi:heparan-alpha-glucosaminide N-acetyltransferase [Rhizobium oryzicola]|uniref:Heparan-alpha-glucosaminide N-acetyltransferase n=1 Tax=Rhizobium oryzicola TaxID=1232668 RepID=A0ABT8SZ70_9HYPH|nr:heparan-alpha-glucosaminide N-acetyltransferase [Rhizobium oryzicola]MDO1583735.1 heparan-alpha-glucosaminide N-acetyltransferase [Rhizobium oryzicola]